MRPIHSFLLGSTLGILMVRTVSAQVEQPHGGLPPYRYIWNDSQTPVIRNLNKQHGAAFSALAIPCQ